MILGKQHRTVHSMHPYRASRVGVSNLFSCIQCDAAVDNNGLFFHHLGNVQEWRALLRDVQLTYFIPWRILPVCDAPAMSSPTICSSNPRPRGHEEPVVYKPFEFSYFIQTSPSKKYSISCAMSHPHLLAFVPCAWALRCRCRGSAVRLSVRSYSAAGMTAIS